MNLESAEAISILLLLFVLGLVAYTRYTNPTVFTTTRELITEAWSGNCQMTCRRKIIDINTHGVVESADGETTTSVRDDEVNKHLTHDQAIVGQINKVGQAAATLMSYACVCRSCPCQILENVLRACKPLIEAYYVVIENSSFALEKMIQTTTHTYDGVVAYVDRHGRETVSAQLVKGTGGSEMNFVFIRKDQPPKKAKQPVDGSALSLGKQKSYDPKNGEAASSKASSPDDGNDDKKKDGRRSSVNFSGNSTSTQGNHKNNNNTNEKTNS